MYDNVLIPTDGSDQATHAVEEGIRLAKDLGATVHALYVVDAFEAENFPVQVHEEEKRGEFEEFGEKVTAHVAEMAENAGVECVTAMRTGAAHTEIADYASDNEVDFVVMGARGHSNVTDVRLGGTADKVVRAVDVPVMLVHEQPSERAGWMVRAQGPVFG